MQTSKYLAINMAPAFADGFLTLKTCAADTEQPSHPMRGHLMERVKEKLGVTDEQAAKIKAELGAEKENLKNLFTKLHEARASLREAIQSDKATEASVRAASAKVAAVQADFAVERLKIHGRISPILTDEQREKLKEIEAKLDEVVESAIDRIGQHLSDE